MIHTKWRHKQANITIDYHLPTLQHEITACDDEEVANQDGMPQRDIIVLVDHSRHGIWTTRASIARQTQSGTTSHEESSHHGSHKRLIVEQGNRATIILDDTCGDGKEGDGIKRLHTKLPSQYAKSYQQQECVERKIRHRHRDAKSPTKDGGNTTDTAHRDMIGQ